MYASSAHPSNDDTSIHPISDKWQGFTGNDINAAFEMGRQVGKEELSEHVRERAKNNLIEAATASERLFDLLATGSSISPVTMFLRRNKIDSFDLLILLAESDFVSEEADKLSEIALSEMKQVNDKSDFYWSVRLMPLTEYTNETAITCDGYTYKYATSA